MALLSVSRETNERFDDDAMTTERMRECDVKIQIVTALRACRCNKKKHKQKYKYTRREK